MAKSAAAFILLATAIGGLVVLPGMQAYSYIYWTSDQLASHHYTNTYTYGGNPVTYSPAVSGTTVKQGLTASSALTTVSGTLRGGYQNLPWTCTYTYYYEIYFEWQLNFYWELHGVQGQGNGMSYYVRMYLSVYDNTAHQQICNVYLQPFGASAGGYYDGRAQISDTSTGQVRDVYYDATLYANHAYTCTSFVEIYASAYGGGAAEVDMYSGSNMALLYSANISTYGDG